jgi:hypothetical protein
MTEQIAIGRIAPNGIIEFARTLDQYAAEIETHSCAWCEGGLLMRYHPHSGGVLVTQSGRTTRQWIYGQCTDCKYQWALWKLRRRSEDNPGEGV